MVFIAFLLNQLFYSPYFRYACEGLIVKQPINGTQQIVLSSETTPGGLLGIFEGVDAEADRTTTLNTIDIGDDNEINSNQSSSHLQKAMRRDTMDITGLEVILESHDIATLQRTYDELG